VPKIVDHDARRAELAAAVHRVILGEGTDAATVRRVAAEAGWSPGALRHYFPDQAALLRFAISLMLDQATARVTGHLSAPGAKGLAHAQALLEEVLPLDDVRRVEMHVWLATMDRARHDPQLDQAREQAWQGIRYLSRVAVAWLTANEPLATDTPLTDPAAELAAQTLHALMDGLALHAFYYPRHMEPPRIQHTLRAHLQEVARSASG
jgi:AcrR family transcriptional regulator